MPMTMPMSMSMSMPKWYGYIDMEHGGCVERIPREIRIMLAPETSSGGEQVRNIDEYLLSRNAGMGIPMYTAWHCT